MNIEDYIRNIYNEFKVYLDKENILCDLNNLHFYSKNIPDYNNIHIQQLYLLRYAYAYIFEYKEMYDKLFSIFLNEINNINILSIGSGACLDFYSLNFICNYPADYLGIDCIDWYYKPENLGNYLCKFKFYQDDFFNILKSHSISREIIFFPKSIGELSNECLELLPQKINSNNLYLLVSFAFDKEDRERLDILLNAFKKENFIIHGDIISYKTKKDEAIYISDIESNFKYPIFPIEIKNDLNSLKENFCKYGNICSKYCDISRFPITTNSKMNYDIIRLIRTRIKK